MFLKNYQIRKLFNSIKSLDGYYSQEEDKKFISYEFDDYLNTVLNLAKTSNSLMPHLGILEKAEKEILIRYESSSSKEEKEKLNDCFHELQFEKGADVDVHKISTWSLKIKENKLSASLLEGLVPMIED